MATQDLQELERYLNRVRASMSPEAFQSWVRDNIAPIMLEGIEERFATQSGPNGESWGTPLVDTGEFKGSFQARDIEGGVAVGPAGQRNETILQVQAEKGREVLGWSDSQLDQVDELVGQLIDKMLEG